ncbi:MAG: glycosyltransferase [Gemmataceae bacterium]|nr:glycosyltransferase [Gemmataceae bacterium]MDW8265687.1 glycosyltransferase [Gemmataceae bacterium]
MDDPQLSVVIPCFNAAAYLEACVHSVQEQGVASEIIIVDDGSTDGSADLARLLVARFGGRLTVVCQANQGPAAARNTGLRLARAPFIGFLDADDQYAAGFARHALAVFEREPGVVGVCAQIEMVDLHRPVAPWQQEILEGSIVSNLIARTEAVRQLGGFPLDAALRGRAAGEDCAFRQQLATQGAIVKLPVPLVRYRVHRGSHFDFFLDRTYLENGRVQFRFKSEEEEDGRVQAAFRRYAAAVEERRFSRVAERMHWALAAAWEASERRDRLHQVDGFLHPAEGYALYWLARHWPGQGRTVEIGSFKGRSTGWLATGCKEGGRDKVAAIDHFRGSPEHQPGGSHADADIAAVGSTLPAFQRHLAQLGLTDWVTVHVGTSAAIGAQWREPIRLLFLDGDHSYEATAQDFLIWSRWVVPHGLVLFHDVGVWPGVTRFYAEVRAHRKVWREHPKVFSMGILEKIA